MRRLQAWLRPSRAGCALILTILSACQTLSVERITPGMTEAQVRDKAGVPTEQRMLPDGSAWYYVNGPFGWTTYRVRFSREGRALGMEQVLTDQNFASKIKPLYTTRQDLMNEFGRPASIVVFERSGDEVWQYRYLIHATQMLCDVHLDQSTGVVRRIDTYLDPAYSTGGHD